jgi:oxygen-independent coproporphyrinogen-3 oxidase
VSFGVQSADPDVLAVLERTHDPALVPEGVAAAKDAGLKVSVDVIYGSPGETVQQWESTLEYVVGLDVEHVSAYALIVEPGTALARRIARGELESPDDDVHADMFLATDRRLTEAGFAWYETSNWSTARDRESAHNWLYWNSSDWWGIGPGAHSHMGGVRWWNVKHPAAYAERLAQRRSPAFHREVLTPSDIALERILLGLRTREGISVEDVAPEKSAVLDDALEHGLLDAQALSLGRITLTQSGRLLADHLAARLS